MPNDDGIDDAVNPDDGCVESAPSSDNSAPKNTSNLPVTLKPINSNYAKPERRNELTNSDKYEKIDTCVSDTVKLGTNGVVYVSEDAFATMFQTTKPKAAYIFEHQISDDDKRNIDGQAYAHSSAVVGLADRKAQEVRDADKQALLQYSRDTLIVIADSPQAQDMRRKVDTLTSKVLPLLRDQRGVNVDEVTGQEKKPGFAFHHVNPKELHTNPEDVVDPSKGRNLNPQTHKTVHKENVNDEQQFEAFKQRYGPNDSD
ncbi:hypothetical protein [Achromobacter xylosoxidans]|uniref:hypothetical protein n=1 Tax=Alcaligenes xylosoxydans xylosoxydans TaxID=85698 RepID=UPI001178749B|nr:hypothetical protein [Achromobacter xylosoxidans]